METKMLADEALREACEELVFSDPGDTHNGWSFVANQRQGSGRWYTNWLLVLLRESDGTFWAIPYDEGLTENQDSDLPWDEDHPFFAHRVYPHEVTSIEYRNKPA